MERAAQRSVSFDDVGTAWKRCRQHRRLPGTATTTLSTNSQATVTANRWRPVVEQQQWIERQRHVRHGSSGSTGSTSTQATVNDHRERQSPSDRVDQRPVGETWSPIRRLCSRSTWLWAPTAPRRSATSSSTLATARATTSVRRWACRRRLHTSSGLRALGVVRATVTDTLGGTTQSATAALSCSLSLRPQSLSSSQVASGGTNDHYDVHRHGHADDGDRCDPSVELRRPELARDVHQPAADSPYVTGSGPKTVTLTITTTTGRTATGQIVVNP